MKIALIGSAPSSIHLAPYEDKSYLEYCQARPLPPLVPNWVDDHWEIWGCSPGASMQLRRVTRFFELHRWEPQQRWFDGRYVKWLMEFRGVVYTGGPVPEIPNHEIYPIERVEQVFSSYFLTSSLALMCALAILEIMDERKRDPGHDENEDVIGFWGVDMAAPEEYGFQKPGCQFFILEALRRNIGVYVPPESCLLRSMPIYGLSEWDHNYIKLTQRSREINQQKDEAARLVEENQRKIIGAAGALEDLEYMVNTWTCPYGLPAGQVLRLKADGTIPGAAFDGVPSDEDKRLDNLEGIVAAEPWFPDGSLLHRRPGS